MRIEKTEETIGGREVYQITHNKIFWAVAYTSDLKIFVYTVEKEPLSANSFTYAAMEKNGLKTNGFGYDNHQEFIEEVNKRGLIFP
jgi:hypothetical protein